MFSAAFVEHASGATAEVAIDVLQALVDLAPALGLVDHPVHLVAEQVACDEDPARLPRSSTSASRSSLPA